MSSAVPMATVCVLAKQPVAGRVKTRLCPPLSSQQAADVAAAALADTLHAVRGVDNVHRVLVLDGDASAVDHHGFSLVSQRTGGLDQRLEGAFADTDTPCVLVGMDTPQLTTDAIAQAVELVVSGSNVLGLAEDGGFWIVGLAHRYPGIFEGVPMSTDSTGAAQYQRLLALDTPCRLVGELRDIDLFDDAVLISQVFPHLATARVVSALSVSETL